MEFWLAKDPLVLASASEVRRAILAAAGIPLETVPPGIDERAIVNRSGLRAGAEIAALLAREKAFAIAARIPDRLVLGADQTLALETEVFSKPQDVAGARAQLKRLRAKTHALHAARTPFRRPGNQIDLTHALGRGAIAFSCPESI